MKVNKPTSGPVDFQPLGTEIREATSAWHILWRYRFVDNEAPHVISNVLTSHIPPGQQGPPAFHEFQKSHEFYEFHDGVGLEIEKFQDWKAPSHLPGNNALLASSFLTLHWLILQGESGHIPSPSKILQREAPRSR